MATYSTTLPVAQGTLARILATFFGALAKGLNALARARRNRREAMALAGLDRSMLKDIGLTRADVSDAFSSPFWEDPTSLLRERAIERRINRPNAKGVSLHAVEAAHEQAPAWRSAYKI
jgi:uncharacterized protein YjiS (DUF1127 family)